MSEMRRSEIARAILAYLCEHPEAQDTLDGVTEWWLPKQRVKSQKGYVKQAINELVARGFVLRHKGLDCQIHYHINRRKY